MEDTLERITKHSGVTTVIVLSQDDLPIVSNADGTATMAYANASRPLEQMARATIRDIDPTNELVAIRMRTKKNEIILAPEDNKLVVVAQSLIPEDEQD